MGTELVCNVFVSSVAIHGLEIIAKLIFYKMASNRKKWSNYVHSCISGTYGVNRTPFWAGTHAVDAVQYEQPLRNETERSQITLNGTNFA